MREYTAYLWIGAWLLIVPFLGVPGSWKDTLTILTALCFIAYALILMRQRRLKEEREVRETSPQEPVDRESNSSTV